MDVVTVFTNGAYRAVIKAFPKDKNKVSVLRHGVHIYPKIGQEEAKKKILKYLFAQANLPKKQKKEIELLYKDLFLEEAILLGNFGFITAAKDPLNLYRLRETLQRKLPNHKIIALYIGMVQKRKDKVLKESLSILQKLKSIHDGKANLFFEHYLPEEFFPLAFSALDFTIFPRQDGTQSGRMAHAQGTSSCIIGRNIEGIGETLKLSGLPGFFTLAEAAEKIKKLVLEPNLKQRLKRKNLHYARQFSYERQAQKHLLIEDIICSGGKLPLLDGLKAYPKRVSKHKDKAIYCGKSQLKDALFTNVSLKVA